MTQTNKMTRLPVAEKIEAVLEERKAKQDRRQMPEARLPASVERRSGEDRRAV